MNDFWNNVLRYPRFFISSLIGLLLVIISPLRNLLKVPKFRITVIITFLIFLIFLFITIRTMLGL